ncbi:tigger transposable element-derived protein 1-like [Vombatus ursinus]|uniref:HTH CENPB-type domain-containing protein n=1 Tax=Vombatus ursinus TaxID=29139 RepID=A0A4X2K6X9_VOMUR|nr:tigger transposable element-derived protein 1-like [Vombatus ursinus]XP_027716077.1 tigger transposable element-derived protein 1-like [Vombatus ursinus]XP_027716078.1 tigger transposable element-derived protein 1-like [Vombatus ursinus]XP_027716079.1 tigger transposable element-derived protein 1-like [Vombatus ursinus]
MSKRPGSKPSSHGCKRKTFSIEEKLEIIKRFERNERTCDIARATGIKESTLRAIRDNAVRIKETSMTGTTTISAKSVRIRPKEIAEMERLLSIWIEGKKSRTTFLTIKGKALSIYADLKRKSPNPAEVAPFRASCGWFSGFKHRYNFCNLQFSREASRAEQKAAKEFPAVIQKLIKEEGYTLDQIFNFDETIIYYKRMPRRTYIPKAEKHAQGYKASKDRLTVMFGANASGDLKLKPVVVYRSDNPRALKGIVKASLGVHYRYSKKGWMTAQICIDIFAEFFPVIEYYCKKKNLAFKILIIIDNAPSHPPTIAELNPKVKFVFLPQEITSLIQPLDQGVIALFKAYYLKRTFKMLIAATGGENAETATEFWKRVNIKMAIDIIVEAWNDVTKECLHRVWKKMLPNLIHNFEECEPSEQFKKIRASCVDLAKQIGFEEVEDEDIEEFLEPHSNDLTTEDLQQLADGQVEAEDEEDDDDDDDNESQKATPRQLDTSQLSGVLSVIEKQLQWLEDNDYNAERSRIVVHGIRTNLEPYRQLLYERRRLAKQQKLDIYFKLIQKRYLEDQPHPSTSGVTTSRSVSDKTPSTTSQAATL